MSDKPKFCKDCRFLSEGLTRGSFHCNNPRNVNLDYVTGEPIYKNNPRDLRSHSFLCSPQGVWFELKRG